VGIYMAGTGAITIFFVDANIFLRKYSKGIPCFGIILYIKEK
jgi:hypothetical protein